MTVRPLEVPSLRPTWDGVPFPGTEIADLPTVLRQAERWIDAGRDEDGGGWFAWPDRPDFHPIYGRVSLNTGSAGVAWYAAAAAAAAIEDGDHQSAATNLARARRAGVHVTAHWSDDLDAEISLGIPHRGLAFYGGLAGIAAVASGISTLEGMDGIDLPLEEMVDHILSARGKDGTWVGTHTMLGDGGIVASLLAIAEVRDDARLTEAAVAVGDAILADERRADVGSTWPGVPGPFLGLPDGFEMDGLEVGTIGVGYVLARLARATGESRFAEAAARAAAHTAATSLVVGDAALFPRGNGQFSFGYCTGSSGVARMFTAVHQVSGNPEHLEWAQKYGRGILRSGVPGRHTPANLYVMHQCCGSAAILETFLGLWLETRDPLWLEAARAQGDDLVIRSTNDDRGRRWYSEAHILPAGQLKAEVGHQVGAGGIALALLRLHQVNQAEVTGQVRTLPRLPDDPYRPTTA